MQPGRAKVECPPSGFARCNGLLRFATFLEETRAKVAKKLRGGTRRRGSKNQNITERRCSPAGRRWSVPLQVSLGATVCFVLQRFWKKPVLKWRKSCEEEPEGAGAKTRP